MDQYQQPRQTPPEEQTRTSSNASDMYSASAYVPNTVPFKVRLWNVTLSVVLLAYGTFGVVTDHFVVPGKRGSIVLYGYPAWIMYGALLCLVANLAAAVIDHYDTRNNEGRYTRFEAISRKTGWVLFFLALTLGLVKHFQDFTCENSVVLKTTNERRGLTAFAYNRHCAPHLSSRAIEPQLNITVVPAASSLPANFTIAVNMNRTDIVRMYWNGEKLAIEYRLRQGARGKEARPTVYNETPVPVELIDVNPGPVAQGSRGNNAAPNP
ncbi:hypothetical protein D3C85_648880 [compost metagenome]